MKKANLIWVFILAGLAGCAAPKAPTADCTGQIAANQEMEKRLNQQQQTLEQLKQQVTTLQNLPPDRLNQLVAVDRIELGRFTGAFDENNDGLSDGFKVYLILRDRTNDVLKAAGMVEIELWDLAEPNKPMLGKWQFGSDELQKRYLSGLLTDHYLLQIPWLEGKIPLHNDLTVKLRFTELLTGRSWDAQSVIRASIHRAER